MDKEFSEILNTDENGQLSFLDPADNYYPVASDYAKIPNRFVERFGNISYLANLGLMYAITKVEKRRRDMYEGTEKGLFFADVYTKTGTDYSQGLVAEFPINEFLKTFNLNRGGRSYNAIDTLYNGELLKNQWQILYQDEDIIASTSVVIGTMYNKKNNMLYMQFNPNLEPILTDIKNNFSMISFPVLGKLRDDFASALYQVLKRRLDFEDFRNKKYRYSQAQEFKVIFDIDYFLFEMGVYPFDPASKDKDMIKVVELVKNKQYKIAAEIEKESGLIERYEKLEKTKEKGKEFGYSRKAVLSDFNVFKDRCLNKAFKRINGFVMPKGLENESKDATGEPFVKYREQCIEKHPTDIHFRYELVRYGRGGKVVQIIFYVSGGQWEKDVPAKAVVEAHEAPIDEMEFIFSLKEYITEKISAKDMMAIAAAANWDEAKIRKAYQVATEQHPDDFVAFMISAIKKDWDPETEVAAEEKKEPEYTVDRFKEKFQFDIQSDIEEDPNFSVAMETVIEMMVDFLNSDKKTVKINRSNVEAGKVRDRLLELKSEDVVAAVNAFLEAKPKTVTENYILTILYNIKQQESLRQAQKAHKHKKQKESPVEPYPMDFIKKQLKYDDISLMGEKYQKEIDSIFNYIYDALNTDEEQIKIGKANMPAQTVKSRLLKLEPFDVITATKQIISSGKSDIVTKTYILTVLYQIHDQETIGLAKAIEENEG